MPWTGLLRGSRGAIAIPLLLAFLVLAVPVALGTMTLMDTLLVGSRTFEDILVRQYSASAGAEEAFWLVANDSSFTDLLTPVDPCGTTALQMNDQAVSVNVCGVYTTSEIGGQGVIATKSVIPTTAPVGVLTTFTYTIMLANESTDAVTIKAIFDYLPPGFTYVAGSTGGLTSGDPGTNLNNTKSCDVKPYRLFWNLESEGISLGALQESVMTFQATATLSEGLYLNQASVRYIPWWSPTGNSVDVYTPYTAEVTVGGGTPYCGYDLNVRFFKDVQPPTVEPGVETEFTYTISAENMSSGSRYVCAIDDRLPPGFTYVTGSAGEYPSNIDLAEPTLVWDDNSGRWLLNWGGSSGSLPPMVELAPAEIRTQVFRAMATPDPGVDYFNELSGVWSKDLAGGHCKTGGDDGGVAQGGVSGSSQVQVLMAYDIDASTGGQSVLSRVQLLGGGQFQILSWQER